LFVKQLFHFYAKTFSPTSAVCMTQTVCGPCLWGHSICSYTLCPFIPMLIVPAVSVYTVTSFIFSSFQKPLSHSALCLCLFLIFLVSSVISSVFYWTVTFELLGTTFGFPQFFLI